MFNGDVLLLSDSRLIRILEINEISDPGVELARVQFIDQTAEKFIRLDSLEVEANLGSRPEIVANFYAMWSMHKRLNLMGL